MKLTNYIANNKQKTIYVLWKNVDASKFVGLESAQIFGKSADILFKETELH